MVSRILVILIVAGVLLGALVYSQWNQEPARVSGIIEADEIRLGSRVGGRIAEVLVAEGDSVEPGQPLIRLEAFDLNARRAEAESNLAAAQAEWKRLQSGFRDEEIAQAKARVDRLTEKLNALVVGPRPEEIEAARARLALADAQRERAQLSFDRINSLFTQNVSAVTRQEFDRATEELHVAEATQQVRQQELKLLLEGTRQEEVAGAKAELEEARQAWQLVSNGYRAEDIAKAKAQVDAADGAIDVIDAQLAELEIRASTPGVIQALELQPGDLVAPNAPILSVIDDSNLWVRAYVPESRLGLSEGQEVWVTVDGFPEERFRGTISYISPQAEFTPSNVQTPEERSKQVFRIKVTLQEGHDRLRPGMGADVWLDF
jgi:multidrug resistance efflux pump